MRKADAAAGVKADTKLKDEEWVIKATLEEIKGRHMEHVGETHEVLSVKKGEVKWSGLPFLNWE